MIKKSSVRQTKKTDDVKVRYYPLKFCWNKRREKYNTQNEFELTFWKIEL